MGIVGIWYASDARVRCPGCENIEVGFGAKARVALAVR
jgi:ribosomal protein S27E